MQLNPELNAFQRKFITEVRRCDEMERKVNYIKKELIKDEMEVKELYGNLPPVPNPREFIDLEALFEKTENEILELSENFSQLLQNFQELTELRYVLERTQVIECASLNTFFFLINPQMTLFSMFVSLFTVLLFGTSSISKYGGNKNGRSRRKSTTRICCWCY